ncbi:MAG: HlyC/CorC family transporter [Deltaproteobacteria bacterium]|nr:HlyC/CorC family transporter [Deltaproteobacteria bacterium]
MNDASWVTTVQLAVLVVLLVCSGSFSATETALFCLDRVERRRLRHARTRRARLIARALERPRELLSTILLGNTFVNVATSSVAVLVFTQLVPSHSVSAAIVVDSLLVLLLGEIIPKTIAVGQPKPLAMTAIVPLHAFSRVSRPVVAVFDRAAGVILRMLKVPEEHGEALSPSELEVLFDEADRQDAITSQERRMVRNIMQFSQTTAAEVMTPRVDVVAALLTMSRQDLANLMVEAHHSRIPICEGSLDHVVGFVSTKEFFLNPDRDMEQLIKPVAIFPEGAKVHKVFRHMQKNRINMAVIVDEYGVTSGIVTMEDLVEEIVGEIYDEYEKVEKLIHSVGPDEWFVQCRASIEDVNEACGLNLPEGESVTLNGYLCDAFGEIPSRGRVLERDSARFTVVESKRGKIVSCRIKRIEKEPDNGR